VLSVTDLCKVMQSLYFLTETSLRNKHMTFVYLVFLCLYVGPVRVVGKLVGQ
jgi:hypothetical protein